MTDLSNIARTEASAIEMLAEAAALLPGDIVQITNDQHHWYPCILVVSELKSFGIQGFVFMPSNDGSGTGEAYIRLRHGEFERVGAAVIMSPGLADERAIERGARLP